MTETIEVKIAEKVKQQGGNTYYVGGFVRDFFRGIPNKDVDIEVHGISPETLFNILKELGEPLSYGEQFGIYSLKGYNIDIAMPRIEHNIGKGHKDFEVFVDPNIDIKKAIKRRDFTINAIYKDVLIGQIIDPFNGQEDINNRLIRHIEKESFIEDPLRVLRGCGFACRFNYEIAQETKDLCKDIDISTLSKQRVEEELKKAILQSNKPSLFFEYLKQMNQLDYWFKDINLKYIDKAIENIDKVNNKYEYLLSTLCIDSNFDITKIINNKETIKYIDSIKQNINIKLNNDYEINKLFYSLVDINDYLYIRTLIYPNDKYLFDKLNDYNNLINKPYVTGKDLIELGYKPGENIKKILEYTNDLRLKGIDKESILKNISEYIIKI